MTNKSEQDGDNSKTIEISDMKYHIFQVCVSRFGGDASFPSSPTLALSIWDVGGSCELVIIFHSTPMPSVAC